jgi:hypothetical protein
MSQDSIFSYDDMLECNFGQFHVVANGTVVSRHWTHDSAQAWIEINCAGVRGMNYHVVCSGDANSGDAST